MSVCAKILRIPVGPPWQRTLGVVGLVLLCVSLGSCSVSCWFSRPYDFCSLLSCLIFFKILFIFREQEREGERERESNIVNVREKHQSVASRSGDWTCNPDVCSDQELKWRPLVLQGDIQLSHTRQGLPCFIRTRQLYLFNWVRTPKSG